MSRSTPAATDRWDLPDRANPFLPGYFADPVALEFGGKYYVYATVEPWGGETLGCWESPDFKHWTYRELNWPTKTACSTPNSTDARVWAPSVVQARDGQFWMYISVGSEIWAGVSTHPLGPWRNALGARPLIPIAFDRDFHMIDADAFIDDDSRVYLYWGSGLNWVNGACFAVELAPDMLSFAGDVRKVTPPNYFEGPTMLKHEGRYYLTYSNGKTITDTYEVRYAVSDHPLGPFIEGRNSPILSTQHDKHIVSPGHHGFFRQGPQHYIVYHRHRIPYVEGAEGAAFRQTCVDELHFTADGEIKPIVATHEGPAIVRGRLRPHENLADPRHGARVTASSHVNKWTGPERAFDNNYATRWAPAESADGAWLQIEFPAPTRVTSSELRLEYAWKPYCFAVESSADGRTWNRIVDATATAIKGSPIALAHETTARYLRLVFPPGTAGHDIGVLEWVVRNVADPSVGVFA
jgi:arabinoxylan arabinofuranohydrolase